MITRVALLEGSALTSVVDRVLALRQSWTSRGLYPSGGFSTLGRASYLDVCAPDADADGDYYSQLERTNAVIQEAFPDLLELVGSTLGEHLRGPTAYAPGLAIPGFHVFEGKGIPCAGQAGPHFDMQYEPLRLPFPPQRPISFTLALELPRCGSGLQLWSLTKEQYEAACDDGRATTFASYIARKPAAYLAYRAGELVIQHTVQLHRIHTPGPVVDHDRRVSLQGHGLWHGGTWHLYW